MAAKLIPDSIRDYLRYSPTTGQFLWVRSPSQAIKAHTPAGHTCKARRYHHIQFQGRVYLAHRVAWFLAHNEQPNVIDHINHDTRDNRLCNLRNVGVSENTINQRDVLGLCWKTQNGKRYVRAYFRGKDVYCGTSILMAYHARIMAEWAYHPIGLPSRCSPHGAP